MNTKQRFTSIDRQELVTVAGGAARVAASSSNTDVNQQLQLMLTSISDSIKELATSKNSSSDQMMPMMMMMMMMGGGGGGGAAPPPPQAPAPAPTYVRVNVRR
jgi:hypothetical protein